MTEERKRSVRNQLDTLLSHLEKKRERILLLQYVVQEALAGNTAALTERIIAKKVYNETLAAGDEKSSTVRTHASNLRDDLADYYLTIGCNDEVIIRLPKPGYVPQFIFRTDGAPKGSNLPIDLDASTIPRQTASPIAPGNNPKQLAVVSVEVPSEFVPEVFLKLTDLVKRFPGPTTITTAFGRIGSYLFYVETSENGFDWLRLLWSRRELTIALGFNVILVERGALIDYEFAMARSRSLETCFSPPFDCSAMRIKEFKLNIDKQDAHASDLTLVWRVSRSLDLIKWMGPGVLFRRIDLPKATGTFSYSLKFVSGWPLIAALPLAIKMVMDERAGRGDFRVTGPFSTGFTAKAVFFQLFIDRAGPKSGVGDAEVALYIESVGLNGASTLDVRSRIVSVSKLEQHMRHAIAELPSSVNRGDRDDYFQPI